MSQESSGTLAMAPNSTAPRRHWLLRVLPLAVIATALAITWWAGWLDYFSLSSLIMHRMALAEFVSQNLFAAIAAYMGLYVVLVAISFPGASLLTVAAGFLFGGIIGGTATVFAATVGASIIFLVARSAMGEFLAQRAGPFMSKMVEGFRRDAFNYLLGIRLTPVFPFWVVNIVPALLKMRLRDYVLATFLGIIPGTYAYAYVGAGLGSVIAAQEASNPGCAAAGTCQIDPSSLVTPQVLLAMIGLAVISILPVVMRRIRARRAGTDDQ